MENEMFIKIVNSRKGDNNSLLEIMEISHEDSESEFELLDIFKILNPVISIFFVLNIVSNT